MLPTTTWFRNSAIVCMVCLVGIIVYTSFSHLMECDLLHDIYGLDIFFLLKVVTTAHVGVSLVCFYQLNKLAVHQYEGPFQISLFKYSYEILFTAFFILTVFSPLGLLWAPLKGCKIAFWTATNMIVSFLWMKTYLTKEREIERYVVEMIVINQKLGVLVAPIEARQAYKQECERLYYQHLLRHVSAFDPCLRTLLEQSYAKTVEWRGDLDDAAAVKTAEERQRLVASVISDMDAELSLFGMDARRAEQVRQLIHCRRRCLLPGEQPPQPPQYLEVVAFQV